MAQIDVVAAIGGGTLIGAGAAGLYLFNGRIAGISGILNGAVGPARTGDRAWRLAFLMGVILGSTIVSSGTAVVSESVAPPGWLLVAGLLVGFGARMGNGCTSGHGVCGIARFSLRSLTATLTFLSAAMVTVFMTRQMLEL